MPYIGNTPAEKYAAFNVQHFTTSATTSYTLDRAVANELDIRLYINNVPQQPGAGKAYTAANTTLTLTSATAGTDTMYAVYIGKAIQTVAPGAGSVGTTALADSSVTEAKLNVSNSPVNGYVLSAQSGATGGLTWAADAGGAVLTGSTNNTVTTVTGANAIQGEANLTFDGTQLTLIDSNAGTDNLLVKTTGDNQISMAVEKSDLKYDIGLDQNNDGSQDFYIRERTKNGSNTNAVRLAIDTDGNVGIGETTPLGKLHVKQGDSGTSSALADAKGLVIESNADTGLSILQHTGGNGTIAFGDSDDNNIGMIQYFHGSVNALSFTTNAEEQVRFTGSTQAIDLNYGETSVTGNVAVSVAGQTNSTTMAVKSKSTGTNTAIAFTDGDNQASGSITVNGSANTTAYNTSSDYRLKENVDYNFDATTELKKLKPAKFNWKNNPDITVEGFLAHEVSSIVPIAVQGSKDKIETKQKVVLGKNGNIWKWGVEEDDFNILKAKWNAETINPDEELKGATWHKEKEIPMYQTMDASKLVPLMVKTIQELEARIKTLENA